MQLSDITIKTLRSLNIKELAAFTQKLKSLALNATSQKKGHLESSLGVAELTVALHYTFNTPEDILIWDVGHQAYFHKIITDRAEVFHTNRLKGGISGFPKRGESPFDPFSTGHSSTSISAVMGFALSGKDSQRNHLAVIGDGALTGGMAFEALNHLGSTSLNVIIIFNDNEKSIDENVGALTSHKTYKEFFESLGITYAGKVSGTHFNELLPALESIKKNTGPRVLHVKTQKNKLPNPAVSENQKLKFQDVFAMRLDSIMEKDPKVFGITPAMLSGSSLDRYAEKYPDRIIDTGITEQHAITLAAGLAADGKKPFVHIYSSFLQRGVDQLIHDVALQKLPVTFVIDRAGIVGEDGATHQGAFDISLLLGIPNVTIIAPRNALDLARAMELAKTFLGPLFIRIPRGNCTMQSLPDQISPLEIGLGEIINTGEKTALLGIGPLFEKTCRQLEGTSITLVDMKFVKPIDEELVKRILQSHDNIYTLEEGSVVNGMGQSISQYARKIDFQGKITHFGLPDYFIEHATPDETFEDLGLTPLQIANRILNLDMTLPLING